MNGYTETNAPVSIKNVTPDTESLTENPGEVNEAGEGGWVAFKGDPQARFLAMCIQDDICELSLQTVHGRNKDPCRHPGLVLYGVLGVRACLLDGSMASARVAPHERL